MSNEANLWKWLRDVLPLGHYSRVESHDTAPGFPDVDCQGMYANAPLSFKLELKFSHYPNRKQPLKENDGLRKTQLIWWRDYTACGGIGWIVIQVGKCVYFIEGEDAHLINRSSEIELEKLADLIVPFDNLPAAHRDLNKLLEQRAND